MKTVLVCVSTIPETRLDEVGFRWKSRDRDGPTRQESDDETVTIRDKRGRESKIREVKRGTHYPVTQRSGYPKSGFWVCSPVSLVISGGLVLFRSKPLCRHDGSERTQSGRGRCTGDPRPSYSRTVTDPVKEPCVRGFWTQRGLRGIVGLLENFRTTLTIRLTPPFTRLTLESPSWTRVPFWGGRGWQPRGRPTLK